MSAQSLIKSVHDGVVESLEWSYQQGELPHLETGVYDLATEALSEESDRVLTYTSDVLTLWEHFGRPEPEEMGQTISESIAYAVMTALREELDVWDMVDAFIASHESLFEEQEFGTDDREMCLDYLAEYKEGE